MKLLTKEIEQKFAEVGSQEHLPDSKKKLLQNFLIQQVFIHGTL